MRRHALGVLLATFVAAPSAAFAQEEDEWEEDLLDDEDIPVAPPPPAPAPKPSKPGAPAPAPAPAPTPAPAPVEEEDLLGEDDDANQADTLDEEGQRQEEDLLEGERHDTRGEVLAPGTDNATLYKQAQSRMKDLPTDEEVMAWEAYLEEYPNSVYRERIEARIDALLSKEYDESGSNTPSQAGDADRKQILLAQSLQLPNLNPRTKIQGGIQFGFPGYFGGNLDYERALLRNVSVHGGITGRFSGWGVEAGARYAFVKSTRDQLVATLIADIRMNFNPVFFQVRPQIGFGKIFGPAQLQMTAGAEIGTRKKETVAIIGGANVTVRVAKPVGVFVESSFHVRDLTRAEGVLAFSQVSLGIKLYPSLKRRNDDPIEISAAGGIPTATQYLQYYYGAVEAQGTYYFPDK